MVPKMEGHCASENRKESKNSSPTINCFKEEHTLPKVLSSENFHRASSKREAQDLYLGQSMDGHLFFQKKFDPNCQPNRLLLNGYVLN